MPKNEFNPFAISGITGETKASDSMVLPQDELDPLIGPADTGKPQTSQASDSLALAASMDPTKEAYYKELSTKSGIEVPFLRTLGPDSLKTIENNPGLFLQTESLLKYYEDPNRAAISYDDAGNLAAAEEKWTRFRRDRDVTFQTPRAEKEREAIIDLFPGLLEQGKAGVVGGAAGVEAGRVGTNFLMKQWRGETISAEEEAYAQELKTLMRESEETKQKANFPQRLVSETGYMVSMMAGLGVMTAPETVAGTVGGTFGMIMATGMNPMSFSTPALTAMAATAFAGSASAASKKAIYNLEAGNAFLDLRDEADEFGNKIDPKVAAVAAHAVGLINTGLEVAGLKAMSKIPGIGKYIGTLTGEEISTGAKLALRDPIFRERVLEIVKNMGAGALGETSTEMLQEIPQMIFGYAVKAYENKKGNTAFKLPEGLIGTDEKSVINLSQIGQVGYSTFLGTLGLGGLPTIHSLYQVGKEAESAQKLGESFDTVRASLQESLTAGRSPAAVRDLVDILVEGSAEESKTLFIDGQEALELFQTDRKAFETLGITEIQINEAATAGDAIEVKTADVLGKMVGPEFNQTFNSFSKILKMSPASLSRNEADRLQTPEAALRAVKLFEESQMNAGLQTALEGIRKQIIAAKYTPEDADHALTMLDRFAHTLVLNGKPIEEVQTMLEDFRLERHVESGDRTIAVDFTPAPVEVEVGPAAEERAEISQGPVADSLKAAVERSPILSEIRKAGGVFTSKKAAKTKGGEYDDAFRIAESFKKHIRGKGKVGELARDFYRRGLISEDSPTAFWKAVQGEFDSIVKVSADTKALAERQAQFREWETAQSEPVVINNLRVGDSYQIRGKAYQVVEESDQAMRVTSEDGYDAWLPFESQGGIATVRIDKGTMARSGAPVELNQIQRAFADRVVAKIMDDTRKIENSETIDPTDEVVGPGKEYYQIHGLEQWRKDLRNWMKRQVEFDGKTKRFTAEEIEQYIAGTEAQFKIFEALGPIQLEKFPHTVGKASKKWGPFRKNQEAIYKISFDASAMCVKRIEMAATMAYIEEQLSARTKGARTALTAAERVALAGLFKLAGKSAPCLYCYVEGPRGKEGSFVEAGMDVLFREGEPGPDWSKATLRRVAEALEVIERKKVKATDIDIGSLLDPLRRDTEETKALHEGELKPIYRLLRSLRGAAKAKKAQTYAEYQGNVRNIPQDMLEELNGYAGLRFFSSSDFQAEHVVDLMQAFIDMEFRKAKAHSYTKVPMFAEIFGATGMKINLSIFGTWRDGKAAMDPWQGMDWDEAKRLRKTYPNVGTVLVATSPEMIEWGLNQDWVDYIIPYHYAAGLETKCYSALDWQNFSGSQKEMWRLTEAEKEAEKKAKKEAKKAGRKWVSPRGKSPPQIRMWQLGLDRGRGDMSLAEYNRQASKRYTDMCAAQGLEPVFERVLLPSNGKSVTTHPNYIKLKKDYARTDTPFDPVTANFSGKKQQKAIEKALLMVVAGETPKATPDKAIAEELLRMIKNAKPGEDIGIAMLNKLGLNKEYNQIRNLGFYSPLENFILKQEFKMISAADLLVRIQKAKTLKKEELEDLDFIGIEDWLESLEDTKVTKELVQLFIQERGPQLFETQRTADTPGGAKFEPLTLTGGTNYREVLLRIPERLVPEPKIQQQFIELRKRLVEKYGPYWTDSATDEERREFERAKSEAFAGVGKHLDDLEKLNFVNKGHFPEANIIAHFRLKDFQGTDGKRVLHIDEIQSDWHQKRAKALKARENWAKLVQKVKAVMPGFENWRGELVATDEQQFTLANKLRISDLWEEVEKARDAVRDNPIPPDAPFKKSWANLAFKRILRLAAEGGYERVTWTTGEQQTLRYNEKLERLSKIEYDGVLRGYGPQGELVFREVIPKEQLHEYVGDEPAARLLEMGEEAEGAEDLDEEAIAQEEENWVVTEQEDGSIVADHVDDPTQSRSFSNPEQARQWIREAAEETVREEQLVSGGPIPTLRGEDLKIKNPGMIKFYDERLKIVANGLGKNYGTQAAMSTLKGGHEVHSLELTEDMKSDILAGQPLYQPGKGRTMGATRITSTSYLVKIFEGAADESTLFHELGHVFLLEMQSLIASGKASTRAVRDWAIITDWLGLKPGESLSRQENHRPLHEKFASGFELYLREGRAPSIELEGAFERFKGWLRKVYVTIKDLWARAGQEVQLTPTIRQVFDRMLATDLEVEAAATRNGLLIPESDLDRMGVKPADKAAIKELLDRAREKGKAKYDKIRARREAEKNTPWVEEATAAFEAERAARTIARIRADKLNLLMVEEIVGSKEYVDELRKRIPAGFRRDGGLDPNQLAAEMGYDSGGQLIQEVYDFPTKDAYVRAFVDRKKEEAGEEAPSAEETLLDGAEAEEVIARIGRVLLKKVNPTKMVRSQDAHIHRAQIAAVAEKKLGEMPLRDAIRVDRFLAAFRSASVKTRDAMGRDDWQAALVYNSQARLQLELTKQSRAIRERLEDQVAAVKKALKSATIDLDYHYNLVNTAFRFGLSSRQIPYDNTRRTLAALLTPDDEAGLDLPPVFSAELLDERRTELYKDLSTDTAMELFDLLKYLEVTGRRLVSGELLTRKETRDEAVNILAEAMPATKATVRPKNSFLRVLNDWVGDYLASCKVLQFIFRAADGLEKMGAHTTMLWNEIQRGYNEKVNRRDAVLEMLRPSLEYFAKRKAEWVPAANMPKVPELMQKDGRSWVWENVLGIALNRGNTYNLEAVQRGYNLSAADIEALTSTLTDDDWSHVQKMWDAIESLWPDLKKTYEDVSVVAPKKVAADPFTAKTAEGTYRLIRGGYFPVSFDSQLALRVEEWNEKDNLLNSFGAAFPNPRVPNGPLQSRVGTGGLPVQLDYRFTLLKHIDFATTYIGLARILKDVDAITRSKAYIGAFVDRFGVQTYKQIRPVLAYIARGSLRSLDTTERIVRMVSQIGTSAAMFGRASTVMKQFFDRGNLASEIGEMNFQRGNLTMLQSPVVGLRFIEEASPMMRERFRQKYAGLNEAIMQSFAEMTVTGKGVREAQELFGLPFRLADMVNTSAAWMGAYQAHLSETLDHDAAVHYADNAITAASPSSRPMDLSAFQRDGSAFKMLFAPFNAWRVKFQNRLMSTTRGIIDGQIPIADAARMSFLELFYPVVGWWLVRAAIQAVPGAPEPPEGEDINDLAMDGVRMITGAFPIVGDVPQLVLQLSGLGRSRGSFQPPALKAVEDVARSLGDIFTPSKEEEDDALAIKRRLWGLAGAASVVLRVPATRLYVDLLEGMRQYEETGRPGLILLPDSDLRRK